MQLSSATVLQTVNNYVAQGNYVQAYITVIADLNSQGLQTLSPDDRSVLTWLNDAMQINSGANTRDAILVRADVVAAEEVEKGVSIGLFGPEEQTASNAVATAFFAALKTNDGVLPNFGQISILDSNAGVVGTLGLDKAAWAGAVPDGLASAFGFPGSTYYDNLTPTQQQQADLTHMIALDIAAGYEGIKDNPNLSVFQKNQEVSEFAAVDTTIYTSSSALATFATGLEHGASGVVTGFEAVWSSLTAGFSGLQGSLNSLFGGNDTANNSMLLGPSTTLANFSSITIPDNTTAVAIGNNNTVSLGNGDTVILYGDGNAISAGNGGNHTINGTNNTISAGAGDTITVAAAPGAASFQDTVNANTGSTSSVINFEGQSIAQSSIAIGTTDSDGRTYTLKYDNSSTTLIITDGADSLTVHNFQNGDFGVNFNYTFSSIYDPASTIGVSVVQGISGSGAIVGYYDAAVGSLYNTGFVDNNGTYSNTTTGVNAYLYNISNNGTIAYSAVVNGTYNTFLDHGGAITNVTPASYSASENNIAFTVPGPGFVVGGINDSGTMVGVGGWSGVFDVGPNFAGFYYSYYGAVIDNGGTVTPIVTPASYTSTQATGINDNGTIVGVYYDSSGVQHGFVDNGGTFTTITDPNAGTGSTYVTGINDSGVIVGYYIDSSGAYHGFIDNGGVFTTMNEATEILGINNAGEIIGTGSGGGDFLAIPFQSISESNSTINVSANQSELITGNGNIINIGAGANVTIVGNGNTVTGNASDQIALNGNNNTATIAASDPLTISGSNNSVIISGSNVTASDDSSSSHNSFTITSGSTGDNLILSGTNDTVTDTGSGNTINLIGSAGGSAAIIGTNDTITGGRGIETFTISNDMSTDVVTNYNTNYTLGFADPSAAVANVASMRVGNDLILTAGDPSTFTLTGLYNNFNGTSKSVTVSFGGAPAVTLNFDASGHLIQQGGGQLQPPIAGTDNVNANNHGSVTGNVLVNDSDPNGLALSTMAETLTTVHGGTFTLDGSGHFDYEAVLGYRGSDSVTYILQDAGGLTALGMVNISNIFTNRPPVTAPETINAAHSATASGNVLVNDTDPDNDPLTAVAGTITTADGGTVNLLANGNFTYQALLGFRGNDSFTYTVHDPYGGSATGTVTLDNVFTNRPPVAVNDGFTAVYGQTITGNILANDSDPDNDPIHVVQSSVTTADGFTIALNPDGTFSYAPPANFLGTDSFSYTVSDNYGATSTATVTLNVNAPPGALVFTSGDHAINGSSHADFIVCGAANVTINGGAGNDTVFGGSGSLVINGGKGHDLITLGSGNAIINGGAGNDTIYGGSGHELLNGGAGHDLLIIGSGAETLNVGGGGNTFQFQAESSYGGNIINNFNPGHGDKIDISNVLTGYDPLHSNIADFVQITTSGNNSILSVDANGPITPHTFTEIAVLNNDPNLNLASLISHGELIV